MRWLVLLLLVGLAGCAKEHAGRYQFVSNSNALLCCDTVTGMVYRLNDDRQWVPATAAIAGTPAAAP